MTSLMLSMTFREKKQINRQTERLRKTSLMLSMTFLANKQIDRLRG